MGRNSSRKLLPAALIMAGLMLTSQDAANAGSMTFLAPREVNVRHSGGSLLRGGLKSMSDEEVVVITPRGEKSVAMSTVSSVIAADGTFKYFPAQDTFDEFLVKSAGMRGVTIVRDSGAGGGAAGAGDTKMIGTVSDAYAKSIGMQSSSTPRVGTSSGGFVQADGFAGASQRPQQLARLEAPVIAELDPAVVKQLEEERKVAVIEAAAPKFNVPGAVQNASSGTAPKFGSPGAAQEVLICSNPKCGKEVAGAKYGDRCPHCGMLWAQQSPADIAAANPSNGSSSPIVDPKNPFAKGPGQAAAPAPGPVAVQQGQPPGGVVPVAGQAQGFGLDTIPWWGKVLGFGASIMLLMWVMNRR